VIKPIYQTIGDIIGSKSKKEQEILVAEEEILYGKDLSRLLRKLEKKMMAYAKNLDFETAIKYREKIKRLKNEK
jgi:excinuclease UvrABC helicase subunit UvrB